MKRRTLTIVGNAAGQVIIPCAENERVRLLSVTAVVAPVGVGEIARVEFGTPGGVGARAATSQYNGAVTRVGFAVGAGMTVPVYDMGVGEPTQGLYVTAPLPDIWFDSELRVALTATGQSAVEAIYEVET